jgi:hypothetical protein
MLASERWGLRTPYEATLPKESEPGSGMLEGETPGRAVTTPGPGVAQLAFACIAPATLSTCRHTRSRFPPHSLRMSSSL